MPTQIDLANMSAYWSSDYTVYFRNVKIFLRSAPYIRACEVIHRAWPDRTALARECLWTLACPIYTGRDIVATTMDIAFNRDVPITIVGDVPRIPRYGELQVNE